MFEDPLFPHEIANPKVKIAIVATLNLFHLLSINLTPDKKNLNECLCIYSEIGKIILELILYYE